MSVNVIRQFHPIGQGAFYTEHMNYHNQRFNVIYDCGSTTSVKLVNDQIEKTFDRGETIHALFISHLDKDHINGIESLIKYCNVERIFFPLISNLNKLLLLKEFNEEGFKDNFTYKFINNPKRAIADIENGETRKPQLIAIKAVSPDIDNNNNNNNDNVFNLDDNSQTSSEEEPFDLSIPSGSIIKKTSLLKFHDEWIYVPFNFDQNKRKKELETILSKSGITVINEEFIQNGKTLSPTDAIKLTKDAYNLIPGKLNGNSMTVFSGLSNTNSSVNGLIYFHKLDKRFSKRWLNYLLNDFVDFYDIIYNINRRLLVSFMFENMNRGSGCLYTGDYDASSDANFDALKNHYKNYWSTITCFQVPHHGSKKNFNTGFVEHNKVYFVSAGMHNRYGHPSAEVIKYIHKKRGYPFIITEDDSSYLMQLLCYDV